MNDRSMREKMKHHSNPDRETKYNGRTPLLVNVRVERAPPRQIGRRYLTAGLVSIIIVAAFFKLLPHRAPPVPAPIIDTQLCYSTLNTSRAYASAEALTNNIDDFCRNIATNVPLIPSRWTQSRIYYPNTPDEYTMSVSLSDRAFGFDRQQCGTYMRSIVNDCDVPMGDSNIMNWKQGGRRVHGIYTYQIDIFRQNRPWPPPSKPRQSCAGWYRFILQHYDVYGAGWANYDWGQRSLQPAINPCCGLGSLTGWNFEYFQQPDENGYEWHAWFNTAIGTRRRCFDNNRVQCAAGGPCDSFCGGNG